MPEQLENALARREHEAAGEVNLSLPDPQEEDEGQAELFELALVDEIASEFDASCALSVVQEQQQGDSRKYALQNPSALLTKQLEDMKQHRTKVLNIYRSSNKVTETTVASDHGTSAPAGSSWARTAVSCTF